MSVKALITDARLEVATAIYEVRPTLDPRDLSPPGVLVELPRVRVDANGQTVTVPVLVVGLGPGDADTANPMLDTVDDIAATLGRFLTAAEPTTWRPSEDVSHPAYRLSVTLTYRRTLCNTSHLGD